MSIFSSLVEFLKAEYLEQSLMAVGEDIPGCYKKEIESYFDIRITRIELRKYTHLKKYDIRLKIDGRGWDIVVGPASLLYATNMQKYREDMLREYSVQGIFTLKNAFFRISTIPAAVMVLNKTEKKTWLTSAISTEDVIDLLTDISSYKRKVYYTEKLDTANFMPEHYNDELAVVNAKLDKYGTKKLQDIADIISGKNANRDHLCDSGISYIRGRNLQQGKLVNVDTFIREDVAENYAKQLLEEGDLLLQKHFGYHKVVQVTADDLPAIASSGLFIIRAFGVPESYLYQYITSETGKEIFEKQLKSIEKGSTIVSISLKELKELRVPIFDEHTMLDFARVDTIKATDLIPVIKSISSVVSDTKKMHPMQVESMLEEKVYNDFIAVGWKDGDIAREQKQYSTCLNKYDPWMADIVLSHDNKLLAVVEIKNDFGRVNAGWIEKMYSIIRSGQVPFLILSTGTYYEIHSVNDKVLKKMISPPTKEILLSLIKGEEGNKLWMKNKL